MNSSPSIPPTDTLGALPSRSSLFAALNHPLPAGMRDLLPGEAESQEQLVGRVLETFELHGFQQVSLPVFEYTQVIERGLGAIEPSSMLRFVEPETGEVVALRPDMTPQVARLIATRLRQGPFPARLSYRGSVLRRRHERARHDQQVLQAGIELVGLNGLAVDLEVLRATTAAVEQAGLRDFVLDLGHGGLATSLLSGISEELRGGLLEALSLKDQAELVRRAEQGGVELDRIRALSLLVELHGDESVFARARQGLVGSWISSSPKAKAATAAALDELEELYRLAAEAGVARSIVIDLGETRSIPYYTGPMFQILAEGPGQAVASGGRYDDLFSAFSLELPAAGAAIHIDHLRWALGPSRAGQTVRALVIASDAPAWSATAGASQVSAPPSRATQAVLDQLRQAKIPSVLADPTQALDYAKAWRYSHVVRLSGDGAVRLSRVGEELGEREVGVMSIELAIEQMRK